MPAPPSSVSSPSLPAMRVVAVAALQQVGAVTADQRVVPAHALNRDGLVAAGARVDSVRQVVADDGELGLEVADPADVFQARVRPHVKPEICHRQERKDERIDARAWAEGSGARLVPLVLEGVVPRAAGNHEVGRLADADVVVAIAAEHDVPGIELAKVAERVVAAAPVERQDARN